MLGVAVLFGGGAIPALGAEPPNPQLIEEVSAPDPTPPEITPVTDPTTAPSEPATEDPAPESTEAPTPTPEPTVAPSPEPAPSDPITSAPAADAPVVSAALPITTYQVTVTPDPAVRCMNSDIALHIAVAPIPDAGGRVTIYHDDAFMMQASVGASGSMEVRTNPLNGGTNSFRVDFLPSGSTEVASTASTTVDGRSYCADLSLSADRDTAVSGETLVRFAAVVNGPWDETGSVTFSEEFNGTRTLGTVALTDVDGNRTAVLGTLGAAAPMLRAAYSGDEWFGTVGSQTVTIEVTGDTGVAASGVGVGYTTFYPYKDDYRDTVAIRGSSLERASVAIKVYSPTGLRSPRLLRLDPRGGLTRLPDGRNTSGMRVAAGKYRVVQTVRDVTGHARKFTSLHECLQQASVLVQRDDHAVRG